MTNNVTVSVYHDLRREKKNGLYPVKLRVYYSGKKMRYPIKVKGKALDLSKDDFTKSYMTKDPRGKYFDIKKSITSFETKANEIIGKLDPFTFDKFERKLFTPTGAEKNIFYYYDQVIEEKSKEDRIKTARGYRHAKQALQAYLIAKGKNNSVLTFEDVTVKFLQDFERWMLTDEVNKAGETVKKAKSKTTVGIYVRTLRAVFHSAVDEGNVSKEQYPFGKRKYVIPGGRKVKKALSREDLDILKTFSEGIDSYMAKARDLWLLTYYCNGMNVRDLCNLRRSDYDGKNIVFYRQKTTETTREDLKPIVVPITDKVKQLIDKYGNHHTGPNSYLLGRPLLYVHLL